MTTPILEARDLFKTYRLGRVRVPVLKGAGLTLHEGEAVAVLGASGSGKSTMLHLLGGLDRPDREQGERRGSIWFEGRELTNVGAGELNRYRSQSVGFVFQFYHLLPELSVLDNVCVGAMIPAGRLGWRGRKRADARAHATDMLSRFGLADRLKHRPAELSGGERQRVAIARALINRPKVLLADEPTGNLDAATGATILDTLSELRRDLGLSVVMVTHDQTIAQRADRVVTLQDGRLAGAQAGPGNAGGSPTSDDGVDEGSVLSSHR
ncbi:MAG: ABC transporter ATP-binding protein [Planctomycetota bacterium]